MDINEYVGKYFNILSHNDICEKNNFESYENFKNFIVEHYNIEHLKANNYIKYVKVRRQIIKLRDNEEYMNIFMKINSIINIMHSYNVFPNIDIKRYLFKINAFMKLIDEKKNNIVNTIDTIRNLYDTKKDTEIKLNFKILVYINTSIFKLKIFIKYSKELIYFINKLIEMEKIYDIDHKLIELNNMERSFLGKKSEYTANKIVFEYIEILNKSSSDMVYYYETNVDILKLLNIDTNHITNLKGEIDGVIISYNGIEYIIEKIIEVKSSIKATFEDIKKFISLKDYILNFNLIKNKITYEKYIFSRESFVNILNKNVSEWTLYICVNGYQYNVIEKSHLYFSSVLKIIDDNFIKDFYIDNNENIIKEKYKIVHDNTALINQTFNKWCDDIKLGTKKCNIYIMKK